MPGGYELTKEAALAVMRYQVMRGTLERLYHITQQPTYPTVYHAEMIKEAVAGYGPPLTEEELTNERG